MLDFNIVTFHREYNYGAVLQAYSLQRFIEEMGYSAGIYDYQAIHVADGIKMRILKKLQGIKPEDKKRKQEKYQKFLAEKLDLNKESDSRIYIAGSDQVWNPTGIMDPTYFLRFAGKDSAKISYAASIGVSHISEDRAELLGRYIQDFTAISVREETARQSLNPLYEGEIEVNIDPVLLHDVVFWKKNMVPVHGLPGKYVLVYLMHFPKNINKVIAWLEKQINLPVVFVDGQGGVQGRLSMLVKHDKALHDVGPDEFVWLIANAEAVVTTSFHAVAFSMLFQKELYPIVGNSLSSRITDLLRKVGFVPIAEDQKSFSREKAKFDSEKVDAFLEEECAKSRRYIEKAYATSITNNKVANAERIDFMAEDCTGCAACSAVCPTQAIQMQLNADGFYVPVINESVCVSCNLCGKACPQKGQIINNKKLRKSWYGWSEEQDIMANSSSGGAVPAMMNEIINQGGVVFSAIYSNDFKRVVFSSSDNVSVEAFRKSKYIASFMENVYQQVRGAVDKGRKVLFCGAPCQVAGLVSFLRQPYDNLITCDFVCGGMPSAAFWGEHLLSLEKKYNSRATGIDFRDKCKGWGKYTLTINFQNGHRYMARDWRDIYFASFNKKISVREVCLRCKYHSGHAADITVGDFWGYRRANIQKHAKGMSLVVANTPKGEEFIALLHNFHKTEIQNQYTDYAYSELSMSASQYVLQKQFFECARTNGFEFAAQKHCNTSCVHHTREWIKTHFGI